MNRKRKIKSTDWTGYDFEHGVVLSEHSVGYWNVQCKHCDEIHVYETRSVKLNAHTKKCKAKEAHNKLYDDRHDGILRRTYGITLEQYNEMYEAQNGLCAICGKSDEIEGRRLAVDHDHNTGNVRALLCGICNRGLGSFQDNADLLVKATRYLIKYANAR